MKKPLLTETHMAEEYNYLYTDSDNMNYYSAKIDDNEYIVVDDYDCTRYTWDDRIWSEENVTVLANNRLLCKREGKYGVVDYEGWTVIPFVYEEFLERKDKCDEKRYNVRLKNRWGVINLFGQDVYKIKYKQPIPINKFNFHIIVEDVDTNRKGVLDFDGMEIIPTIFSQIKAIYLQNDNQSSALYYLVSYGTDEDSDNLINGIWGCYNWKGEEIIPVKFHSIHCIKNYFIVGDNEYIGKDYNDEDYYIGTYDLYDKDGNMIIGGFNHIQINENYFILQFGIEVKQHWETKYWGEIPYDEELNYEIVYENSLSIIIDEDLKSLVPIHLITDYEEDIKYEYDILMNNVSEGQGILIGEYPNLKRGKRYSSNDKIIQKISVRHARFDANNIIIYAPYKEVRSKKEYSYDILRGLIFCREHMMISPLYLSMKAINEQFVFVQNDMNLVGIRSFKEELIKPQFDLITNFHKGCAVAFKIICRTECDNELEDDNETQTYTRECEYTILRNSNNAIVQERGGVITDTELYDLLYSSDLSLDFIFNTLKNDDSTDKEEYWRNIPRNEKNDRFWFPLYSDFKYLSNDYNSNIDKQINEWDDNWDYYNDNLDMDQQSPEFWYF